MSVRRCAWSAGSDPLMVAYHDEEWGVPSHDDVHLFELLTLEGAQSGLSWSTILRKREGYRRAFSGFEPEIVARFGAWDLARLVADEGIVRNRLKIESVVSNAHAVLRIKEEVVGGFAAYLWSHVDGAPTGRWRLDRPPKRPRRPPATGRWRWRGAPARATIPPRARHAPATH